MKRLNLRVPKSYKPENSGTEEPKIGYYIVAEGPTEESYFEGIRNNKRRLGIKNQVYIEVLPKEKGEETLSHPYQLVMAALECMGRVDKDGNERPVEEWHKYCKWEFDAQQDKVCIIFDRDYKGLEEKLDIIFGLCEKHHIYIGLSNPNFELWLLMHFSEIEKYDRKLLYKNPKNLHYQLFLEASKNKKYLEILVAQAAGGYTKGSKIRFERFMDGVFLAVRQEKMFEEDIVELKENLGSNIGCLISEIMGIT